MKHNIPGNNKLLTRNSEIVFLILISLVPSIIATYYHYLEIHRYRLIVEMSIASENDSALSQLFFDIGNGFNNKESDTIAIQTDGQPHSLSYELPHKKVKNIRLDPLDGSGKIIISGIKLETHLHKEIPLDLKAIVPSHQIKNMHLLENGALEIITEDQVNDPSLLLPYAPLPAYHPIDFPELFSFGIKLFMVYFFGFLVIFSFFPLSRDKRQPACILTETGTNAP